MLLLKKIFYISYLSTAIIYSINFINTKKILNSEDYYFLVWIAYLSYFIMFKKLKKSLEDLEGIGILLLITIPFCFIKGNFYEIINLFKGSYNNLFIASLGLGAVILWFRYFNIEIQEDNITLFSEREGDLSKIISFIEKESSFSIFGIDSEFGEGKTVIVNEAIKRLKNNKKIEIIKVSCMLIDKNDVYPFILNKLNKILKKNFITTAYTERITNSIISGISNKFGNFLSWSIFSGTNVDDIESFKEAFRELDKTVVLVFEDIDRGSDVDKIERLLSFIDDFAGGNIKIIVNYSLNNLRNIDPKFNRNYIEKYIPNTTNLTKLEFSKLLLKEVKNQGLSIEKFNFLRRLEGENYFIRGEKEYDYQKATDEMKFFNEISTELQVSLTSNYNISPRKMNNFIREVKEWLGYEISIDERIIISFLFLKTFFYEEFYEKVGNKQTFEETFPINFYCKNLDETFTLKEFEILHYIKYNLIEIQCDMSKENEYDLSYIDICDERIFFSNKYSDQYNLNYFLKKLGLVERDVDNTGESYNSKFLDIKKKMTDLKFEVNDDSKVNFIIYGILNYYSYFKNSYHSAYERNNQINNGLKKLKHFGTLEHKSSYKRFYDKFIKILDVNNLKESSKNLDSLLHEYYNSDGSFEGIFLMGEFQEEKIMETINIFGNQKIKEDFLQLIKFQESKRIDKSIDLYIITFLTGNFKSIKISDEIITLLNSDIYKITEKRTLDKIKENIERMLPRLELRSYHYNQNLGQNNKDFFNHISIIIGVKFGNLSRKYDKVGHLLKPYEIFLKKLKSLSEDSNLENPRVSSIISSVISSVGYPEYVENILNSETKEEAEKKLINLLEEGYGLETLSQIQEKIDFKFK